MIANRRQFILTNNKIDIPQFETIELKNAYLLYHRDLEIQIHFDQNHNKWILVGTAFSTDLMDKTPESDMLSGTEKSIVEASFNWSGRWALINEHTIYTDATGLMGLYYYCKNNMWVVSSSLNVIYTFFPNSMWKLKKEIIVDEISHSFPAPDTVLQGVSKVFPSQYVTFNNTHIDIRYIEKYHISTKEDYCTRIKALANRVSNAVYNVGNTNVKPLYIALTCGYDSRVLLAALLHNHMSFSAYTMQHDVIKKNDSIIPKQMSKRFGFNYQYIKKRDKPDKLRLEAFDMHTLYSIDEADRMFFACRQTDNLPENASVLKGGILDLIRGSQYPVFKSPKDMLEYIISISPHSDDYRKFNHSLSKWFDWVEKNPNDLDIRDRFNIEIFLGGWLSNLQQSVDLLDQTFIQICNSAAIISLILSFSEEERKSKQIYYDLYKELYPAVLDYPINPKERLHIVKYYYHTIKANPMVAYKKLLKKAETIFKK